MEFWFLAWRQNGWRYSWGKAFLLSSLCVGLSFGCGDAVRGQPQTWQDPSPHEQRFVVVDGGVRLEIAQGVGPERNPVDLPKAAHYVFLIAEAAILKGLREFLATLSSKAV